MAVPHEQGTPRRLLGPRCRRDRSPLAACHNIGMTGVDANESMRKIVAILVQNALKHGASELSFGVPAGSRTPFVLQRWLQLGATQNPPVADDLPPEVGDDLLALMTELDSTIWRRTGDCWTHEATLPMHAVLTALSRLGSVLRTVHGEERIGCLMLPSARYEKVTVRVEPDDTVRLDLLGECEPQRLAGPDERLAAARELDVWIRRTAARWGWADRYPRAPTAFERLGLLGRRWPVVVAPDLASSSERLLKAWLARAVAADCEVLVFGVPDGTRVALADRWPSDETRARLGETREELRSQTTAAPSATVWMLRDGEYRQAAGSEAIFTLFALWALPRCAARTRERGRPCVELRRADPDIPRRWVEIDISIAADDSVRIALGAIHRAASLSLGRAPAFPAVDAWVTRKASQWGHGNLFPPWRMRARWVGRWLRPG